MLVCVAANQYDIGAMQAALTEPPRPVDLLVRPGARVVMITGPVRALLISYHALCSDLQLHLTLF